MKLIPCFFPAPLYKVAVVSSHLLSDLAILANAHMYLCRVEFVYIGIVSEERKKEKESLEGLDNII